MKLSVLQHKSIRETLWALFTKGSSFIWFALINLFLARGLGAEGFGQWSFLFALMTVLSTIGILGFNDAIRSFSAQYNKTNALPELLKKTFSARIVLSICVGVLMLGLIPGALYFLQRSEFIGFTLPIAVFVFFNTINAYGKQLFFGLHYIRISFWITSSEFISKTLAIAVAFLLGVLSVSLAIYSFILGAFVGALLSTIFLFVFLRRYQASDTEEALHASPLFATFKYALPLFFASLGFILLTEIDTLMLGALTTDTETGIYGIAKQISIKLPQISLAIALGTLPAFAKLSEDNKEELRGHLSKVLKVNNFLFLPLIGSGIILAPWLIPFVFGEDFSASVIPLQILLIYTLLFANNALLGEVLTHTGKANKRARNMGVTIVLNILLNAMLIPQFGAEGAAIATVLSYLPLMVLNGIETWRVFK